MRAVVCRELRRKRLVDAAMRKHGLKSASKKARALAAAEDEVTNYIFRSFFFVHYILNLPDMPIFQHLQLLTNTCLRSVSVV